jgi:hypothetical protein
VICLNPLCAWCVTWKYNFRQGRLQWESTLLLTGASSSQSNSILPILHTNRLAQQSSTTNRETSIDWRLNYRLLNPWTAKNVCRSYSEIQTRWRVGITCTVAKTFSRWELKEASPLSFGCSYHPISLMAVSDYVQIDYLWQFFLLMNFYFCQSTGPRN